MRKNRCRSFVIGGLLTVMILLTGCAGGFSQIETVPVSERILSTSMQFAEGPQVGPTYDVSVEVPQDWVGQFEVQNTGNRISFDFTGGSSQPGEIFFIDALSPGQYWKQAGSYPGSYANIINKGDTFFIYYLPIDSFYSDLPEEEFLTLSESVPSIIESFEAVAQ